MVQPCIMEVYQVYVVKQHYRCSKEAVQVLVLVLVLVLVQVLVLVLVLQVGNVHQLFCLLNQSPPAAVASDFAKSVLITSAVWSRDHHAPRSLFLQQS